MNFIVIKKEIVHFQIVLFGVWLVIVLCTSCMAPASSLADKKNYTENDDQYKKRYAVTFEEGEKPLRYWYHYVISKVPSGYKARIFHPDKLILTEEKVYSTPSLTLLHGPYNGYWDDGSIRAQGFYQYGRRHGTWLECEPGQGKTSSGPYLNDKKEGIWTQLDTSGLVESVYTWKDGQRHGKFFEYDTSGHKINEGIYKSDTLVAELFKRTTVQKPYLLSCRETFISDIYACTEQTLIQKINAQLRYPSKARQLGIEGIVRVQWDVMSDGSVQNFRIPQALCDEIEEECRKVLNDMPDWVPAQKESGPVKWPMSLPIHFRL